jgi:4-hydroxybutyrate dehydrogenase
MKQFNYPTTLLYGEGSLNEASKRLKTIGFKKPLLVTDETLVKIGIIKQVTDTLKGEGIDVVIFDQTHPNPIEDDCINGAQMFKDHNCDSLIAVGGGSPMDAAKGIMVLATHEGPLSKYDDAKGGDQFITEKLPPMIAIPTTAGTGSEVGRSGVIIVNDTKNKTIIFHPTMMPVLAVLEPSLTVGLPTSITAATGIDAFIHSLEAYLAPGFHPMADGIAIEAMKLVIENLGTVVSDGSNIEGRSKMLLAASMGATAFQKGLGMIHSIAHPLSSVVGLHHGLANALVTPECLRFIESSELTEEQKLRIENVKALFKNTSYYSSSLCETTRSYFEALGIKFGLVNYGVKDMHLDVLAEKAFLDVCHQTNMIPVNTSDFKIVIEKAL